MKCYPQKKTTNKQYSFQPMRNDSPTNPIHFRFGRFITLPFLTKPIKIIIILFTKQKTKHSKEQVANIYRVRHTQFQLHRLKVVTKNIHLQAKKQVVIIVLMVIT